MYLYQQQNDAIETGEQEIPTVNVPCLVKW